MNKSTKGGKLIRQPTRNIPTVIVTVGNIREENPTFQPTLGMAAPQKARKLSRTSNQCTDR